MAPMAMILASSEEDPDIEQAEIRMILARGVDALLISSCQSTLQGFFSVHGKLTPFVLLDRPFPQLRANFVGADDYAGGKIATEHLIQIGRRRLAYIGSPDLGPAVDRFRGFRSALQDHGIELREKFIISSQVINDPADNLGFAPSPGRPASFAITTSVPREIWGSTRSTNPRSTTWTRQ
jgi:LacI family transcriptional regulator